MAVALEEWSPAELLALVEGLPPTSRFIAHVQGGEKWFEHWGWGKDRHMFAEWIDVFVKANTANGKKAWTYPRPGDEKKPTGPSMRDAVLAMARNQDRG